MNKSKKLNLSKSEEKIKNKVKNFYNKWDTRKVNYVPNETIFRLLSNYKFNFKGKNCLDIGIGNGDNLLECKKRGAKIYAQLTGYAATSDGVDMVSPSGEGGERCMQIAWEMSGNKNIDYINAHGTSTPAGDITELNAIKNVFGDKVPWISSTKSLSGHSLGAAGVQEAIYGLIMMDEGFIAGSANIENLDEGAEAFPIVRENVSTELQSFLSNSFGFGGTNASLIFEKI